MKLKCTACGYEKRTQDLVTDVVERYRSGKRKGEIKSVEKRTVTIYESDPDWIEITLNGVEQFQRPCDAGGYGLGTKKDAELYACPCCGTVKLDGVW